MMRLLNADQEEEAVSIITKFPDNIHGITLEVSNCIIYLYDDELFECSFSLFQ